MKVMAVLCLVTDPCWLFCHLSPAFPNAAFPNIPAVQGKMSQLMDCLRVKMSEEIDLEGFSTVKLFKQKASTKFEHWSLAHTGGIFQIWANLKYRRPKTKRHLSKFNILILRIQMPEYRSRHHTPGFKTKRFQNGCQSSQKLMQSNWSNMEESWVSLRQS